MGEQNRKQCVQLDSPLYIDSSILPPFGFFNRENETPCEEENETEYASSPCE